MDCEKFDRVMLDLLYDLPDLENEGAEYVVDEAALAGKPTLEQLRVKRAESA